MRWHLHKQSYSLATKLIAEAKAEGKGVAVKDNKFIGPPMLKMAEKILSKRNQIISKQPE